MTIVLLLLVVVVVVHVVGVFSTSYKMNTVIMLNRSVYLSVVYVFLYNFH